MQQMTVNYDNIRKALKPDRIDLKCRVCGKPGAVIGCCNATCAYTAHYDCAIQSGLAFENGKMLFCKQHRKKADEHVKEEQ